MSMYITRVSFWEKIDLALTSDPGEQWRSYQEAIEEFYEWFDDTKEEREREYRGASGDAKIRAGRDLLEFVIAAYARWDEIKMPKSGTWSGPYESRGRISGMIQYVGGQTGHLTLTLEEDAPGSTTRKVTGELTDGRIPSTLNLSAQGVTIVSGDYDATWDGQVVGSAGRLMITALIDGYRRSGEGVVGVVGGAVVHLQESGDRVTTERYLVDVLRRIYSLGSSSGPADNRMQLPLKLSMTGREEEFDATELLNCYFVEYVETIDDVKHEQHGIAGTPQGRRDRAHEALNLLLGADALGEAAGVAPNVRESTGLILKHSSSLYDMWYRLYFPSAMVAWQGRVSGAPDGQSRVTALEGRVNFVLENILGPIRDVVSDALFETLQFEYASPLVDGVYRPYYDAARSLWVARLRLDASLLSEALAWLGVQVIVADGGIISSQLANNLGLLNPTPRDEAVLRQAAEGGA